MRQTSVIHSRPRLTVHRALHESDTIHADVNVVVLRHFARRREATGLTSGRNSQVVLEQSTSGQKPTWINRSRAPCENSAGQ